MKYSDAGSIEALFRSYSRGMFNICLRMIGNRQDAEDVLQDAFSLAYTNLGSLKSMDSFGAWMKRIVINQCIRFLRSRVHFVEIDHLKRDYQDEPDMDLYEFSMQEINAEIRKLPDGCRIVFNLYLLENYTHRQIAEMLDISESTSKSQYQRARELLQNQLKSRKVYG